MSTWRRVTHEGQQLLNIGIAADGSLVNPNGYPEAVVRAAVEGAEARRAERRKRAAAKAVETRKRRQERRIYAIARKLLAKASIGPRVTCASCARALEDPISVERGIGPECLERVKAAIESLVEVDG